MVEDNDNNISDYVACTPWNKNQNELMKMDYDKKMQCNVLQNIIQCGTKGKRMENFNIDDLWYVK